MSFLLTLIFELFFFSSEFGFLFVDASETRNNQSKKRKGNSASQPKRAVHEGNCPEFPLFQNGACALPKVLFSEFSIIVDMDMLESKDSWQQHERSYLELKYIETLNFNRREKRKTQKERKITTKRATRLVLYVK
jgi:hypothetical protein